MTIRHADGEDRASASVCPYCGQPLRDVSARVRLAESESRLTQRLDVTDAESTEEPPPEPFEGETISEAAKRAHDLRVQTRIF